MTHDQQTALFAAKSNVLLLAHRMVELHQSGRSLDGVSAAAERDLLVACKQFAATVNAIDPCLWEPTVCCPSSTP